MTQPPPNGTPAQSERTSTPQICTIASASRGRSIGIGPIGATAGAAVAAGAPPDGAAAGAPPLMAATALRHAADSCASLRLRHCSASAPPGCTPEQCDMKSDRHEARTAAFCCAVGAAAEAAGAAGAAGAGGALVRAGSTGFGSTGFLAGAACFAGSAGVAAAGGAVGSACSAAWQLGERSVALAFRHNRISGLFGAIQEQCATKSLSVQACCTLLS